MNAFKWTQVLTVTTAGCMMKSKRKTNCTTAKKDESTFLFAKREKRKNKKG